MTTSRTRPAAGRMKFRSENYYVGYHEPDNYHVEVHVPNDNAIVTVPGHTFDNFNAETQVFVAKANTAPTGDFRYGLVFRRAGSHFYAFTISPRTKTWYVLKSSPTGLQVLGQGTQDSIQGLQALDTLRVNAQGPVMTFYVNGQSVGQITDVGLRRRRHRLLRRNLRLAQGAHPLPQYYHPQARRPAGFGCARRHVLGIRRPAQAPSRTEPDGPAGGSRAFQRHAARSARAQRRQFVGSGADTRCHADRLGHRASRLHLMHRAGGRPAGRRTRRRPRQAPRRRDAE